MLNSTFDNVTGLLLHWAAIATVMVVLFAGLCILTYVFILWWRWRNREEEALKFILLHIAVPFGNEIKIDAMEQVISSLYSIKTGGRFKFLKHQPHLSFEIVSTKNEIKFYIACPKKFKELVERQIHSSYPDAEIHESEDEHNIFSEEGKVAYSWLILRKESYYPLKTYKELSVDPLSAVTSAMAKLGEDEGALVQIVINPAESGWQKEGKGFISTTKKQEASPDKASFKVDARTLEAIENKCSRPGFETAIRMVVCASTTENAKEHLSHLKSAFSQFDSPWNGLKSKKIRFKYSFMLDVLYRYQPLLLWGDKTVLNTEELASIFHFPNKTIETPNIFWTRSKHAAPPPNLPKTGLYLGKSVYRGTETPVYISELDRQRHFYIVGKTGTGKSELLKDMILQDIKAGKGVCFIDPHDTIEKLLELIPPERGEDIIYFDPSLTERPMGINFLEAETEDQKHFITSAIINLMYKLYDPYKTGIIGPRFEHAIRNAMLTAMCEPGTTFVEVVKILENPGGPYLQRLLPKVKDPMVRAYWTEQIAHTSDFHKSETLDYIVSKFGRFVTNKMMRNIIGQAKSSFNFRKVMDEGKILLINLAKGKIGEENASFLGMILVPQILMASMSRQDIPEEQRRDFYLYVDEFQNFSSPDFAQILSEARKYHLNLTVANQFISQMDDEVKNAIFGNIGTVMTFRVGVSDANFLAREFQPTFNEQDFLNIEKYHVYIKTLVNLEPVPPFSMDLTRDMESEKKARNPKLAETLKRLSILKYGKPASVVEAEIMERTKY